MDVCDWWLVVCRALAQSKLGCIMDHHHRDASTKTSQLGHTAVGAHSFRLRNRTYEDSLLFWAGKSNDWAGGRKQILCKRLPFWAGRIEMMVTPCCSQPCMITVKDRLPYPFLPFDPTPWGLSLPTPGLGRSEGGRRLVVDWDSSSSFFIFFIFFKPLSA